MDIPHERFGPPNGRRCVGIDTSGIGYGDALIGAHRPVSRHAPPILRRGTYLAALRGDPWRPRI
jgi:hypothetical protein